MFMPYEDYCSILPCLRFAGFPLRSSSQGVTMKAVQLIEVGQPMQLREVPIPRLGGYDVLVRIRAAGVCHSDAHYRAGRSTVRPLPMTLGHEISGIVERTGEKVTTVKVGDRVCLHYLLSCGGCLHCSSGHEQFCSQGSMLGHYSAGGYAEFIVIPEKNAIQLPDEIPFEQGAVLMCSSSTCFHALRKARLKAGERVAVFGTGGLGMSAIQLARAFGALEVFAVDINDLKLEVAAQFGAIPINARLQDPVQTILKLTGGKGADVSLELIGLVQTMKQAVQCLAVMGRAVIAGICDQPLEIETYRELLGKEAEIIGSNDHLLQELPLLLELARRGILDLSAVVTRTVPLEANVINEVLDSLEQFDGGIRTVIVP
jgi:2-desacetyl-2-hydroxyethyl bacteriochlorophyllide A dehydrogenase